MNEIVGHYGSLRDAERTDEGILRIEYRTQATGSETITKEVFTLATELKATCDCSDLSIYAQTGKNSGVLVAVATANLANSYEQFRSVATITVLE